MFMPSPIYNLPPLKTPEPESLRSRLEQSLLLLTELCEADAAIPQRASQKSECPNEEKAGRTKSGRSVPAGSPDRRAFPRREGNCRVAVCRLSEEDRFLTPQQIEWRLHATTLKGTLADLSLSGAAVLLEHPLPAGETVILRLFCPRRDTHVDQRATIVSSLADPAGENRLMCQFCQRLSLEQVSFFSRFLNDADLM